MQYDSQVEKERLLSEYTDSPYRHEMELVIDFLVREMNNFISAVTIKPFRLGAHDIFEGGFDEDFEIFQGTLANVEKYAQKKHCLQEAAQMRGALTHMRCLIDNRVKEVLPQIGNDEDPKLQENIHQVVGKHYKEVRRRLKDLSGQTFGAILHQKLREDRKARRFRLEDREAYKFVKKAFHK